MATMDRIFSLYNDCYESSLETCLEWRLIFVPSYKTEQMRENVVLAKILKS